MGRYYRDYVRLMDHWDKVLPGFVLRVQHEDVVEKTVVLVEAVDADVREHEGGTGEAVVDQVVVDQLGQLRPTAHHDFPVDHHVNVVGHDVIEDPLVVCDL